MGRRRRDLGARQGEACGKQGLGQSCAVAGKAWFSSPWPALLFIVVVGLLAFSNNYGGEFIFDDFDTVVENPSIQTFSPFWTPLWSGADTPNTPLSGRPLVALTFALNFAAGGLDVRGYHLVNNLIHILAAVALFGLIWHTLLLPKFSTRFGHDAAAYALAVALLWMLHPLQTEAVNYLTQRTESLMGLCYLLTLCCAAGGLRSARPRQWYAFSVGACLLGMGCKEVMVSAPLLVLLYDRLFVAGSFREAIRQRSGFYLALAGTWSLLVFLQLNSSRAATFRFDLPGLSAMDYLRTQLGVVLHYLRLVFWPQFLVLDSQDWPIAHEFSVTVVASGMALGSLLLMTLYALWRGFWWSAPGVLFFLALAPTSSFLPVYTEIVAERRMYLPLAAVIVCVVFAVDALGRKVPQIPAPQRQRALLAVLAMFSMTLGTLTWQRNLDYRSAAGLWADTVTKRPGNFRAHNNLGETLVREGRIEEAIGPFREAVRLKPDYGEAHSNLGSALATLGQFEEAIAVHRQVIAMTPDDAVAHYNLANSLLRTNDARGAASAYRQAIAMDPGFAMAHGNLGLLLLQQGDMAGAALHLQELLRLEPRRLEGYLFLADLRVRQGLFDEAIGLYRQGQALYPDSQEIAERLARALGAREGQNKW